MPIDYSEYPPNWKTEIRPAVMKRAGETRDEWGDIKYHARCEDCGAPNHKLIYRPKKGMPDWKLAPEGHEADAMALDGVKFTKVVLTVAHLDHDKENHGVKIDRLKALCQRCHLLLDKNHHAENRKYGRNHKENNLKLFCEHVYVTGGDGPSKCCKCGHQFGFDL
jgi:hypothetical protein